MPDVVENARPVVAQCWPQTEYPFVPQFARLVKGVVLDHDSTRKPQLGGYPVGRPTEVILLGADIVPIGTSR